MARNQTNTAAFADALLQAASSRKRRLLIVSDSQWSPDANTRLLLGMRNRMDIPVFGWTTHALSTIGTNLPTVTSNFAVADTTAAARQFATSSPYDGTGIFAPGSLGISPTHWSERQFTAAYAGTGSQLWRAYFGAGAGWSTSTNHFASFKRGSWLHRNMTAKVIYYHNGGAPSLTKFTVNTYRGNATLGSAVYSATFTPSGTGVFAATGTCNGSGEPVIGVFTPSPALTYGTYDGTAVAESSLAILGSHLESADVGNGVSITPISNAGWTAEAHASTTTCSDANLRGYLTAVGVPDMVLIMLGHNLTSNEISGGVLQAQWKTNVSAVVARYKAQLEAAGASNIPFLLVAPWYVADSGGYADSVIDAEAVAMHEIARDTASGLVGHVNMAALCGSGASLVAAGYLGAADIHPQSAAACNFFFDRLFDGVFASGAPRLRHPLRGLGR